MDTSSQINFICANNHYITDKKDELSILNLIMNAETETDSGPIINDYKSEKIGCYIDLSTIAKSHPILINEIYNIVKAIIEKLK